MNKSLYNFMSDINMILMRCCTHPLIGYDKPSYYQWSTPFPVGFILTNNIYEYFVSE